MSPYPQARSEGIVTEEVGDELVIYVAAMQTAHALSEDAAAVWRHCDGRGSAEAIASRVGLDEVRVVQALEELSGAELLVESEGISRREVYKRSAKLAAAALSAPLIYSIAIPAAAAAASGICANLALSATGDGQFGQVANDPDGAKHYTDDFDTVDSASATFRVTNKGPGTFGPLTFSFSNNLGGYALSNNGCSGSSLASGASCTFDLSFNAAAGDCTPDSERFSVVTVSGTGAACLRLTVVAVCPGL